jgi:hypothetical protein
VADGCRRSGEAAGLAEKLLRGAIGETLTMDGAARQPRLDPALFAENRGQLRDEG